VVDVGVGEQEEMHAARLIDGGVLIAALDGLVALVHAAVDGETGRGGLDHMAGAGHGAGRAEEFDLHDASGSGPVSIRPRLANIRPRGQYRRFAGNTVNMPCTAWGPA